MAIQRPPSTQAVTTSLKTSRMLQRCSAVVIGLSLLSGCMIFTPNPTLLDSPKRTGEIVKITDKLERDRQAILAMLGEYRVTFDFKETVALQSGYDLADPKNTDAYETVILLEDSGTRISLQHLLVIAGSHIVKHWRQDWAFETPERLEFTEDQTWRLRSIAESKRKGMWTQCVYEVSDAPRYCGTGKWNHQYGTPTWTSDRSWRPLPRREYTVRNDYNALNVENRHSITPSGWTHEQDNTKAIRDGNKLTATIAREFGFNDYRRVSGVDFSAAYNYWKKTESFWAAVRADWQRRLGSQSGIALKTTVDGMAIIEPIFAMAKRQQNGEQIQPAEIAKLLDTHTTKPNEWLLRSSRNKHRVKPAT